MYHNMDCVVYGYGMFSRTVELDVFNAANEKIENPVYILNGEAKVGVMVPYGGYVYVQTTEDSGLQFNDCNSGYNFTSVIPGSSGKIKVVRDCYVRVVTSATQTDYQVV